MSSASELNRETVLERAYHALESDEDTGQRVIAVLIILVTVLAAGTAFLERKASTHQALADRAARVNSALAVGAQVETDTKLSEELVLHDAATSLTRLSEDVTAHASGAGRAFAQRLAAAYAAAGTRLESLRGEFFSGFRATDGTFDYDRLYISAVRPGFVAEEWSKAYARERSDYASKRGFFIAVITILAVSLFLLGLTLTVPIGHRSLFLVGGSLFGLAGVVLGLVIWARPVAHPARRAIFPFAYAEAVAAAEAGTPTESDRGKYDSVVAATTRALEFRHDYEKAYLLRADTLAHLDQISANGPQGSPAALADYAKAVELDPKDYFAWANYASQLTWSRRFDDAVRANTRALAIQGGRPIGNMNQATEILMADSARAGAGKVVRSDAYRKQLDRVRRVLLGIPARTRDDAMAAAIADSDNAIKYQPEYEKPARAALEDLLRIDHAVDATLAKTTPGPYPGTAGRVAITGVDYSADRKMVNLHTCFLHMAPSDERLYYAYVDRRRVSSSGPDVWGALPSSAARAISLDLGTAPDPGAPVRVEVFVNGRLRAERTIPAGKSFSQAVDCPASGA